MKNYEVVIHCSATYQIEADDPLDAEERAMMTFYKKDVEINKIEILEDHINARM